jgi:arylsulfatase A-like enzyme
MTAQPSAMEPDRTEGFRPGAESSVSVRSWLRPALTVGLVGGMIVGAVEPFFHLWSVRGLMTTWLWVEAVSFSLASHMVIWTIVCTISCALGRLAWLGSRWWRARIDPGSPAVASVLVGLTIIVIWAKVAMEGVRLARGLPGMVGAIVLGLGLLVPTAWVATRLRSKRPARRVMGLARIAVWPAIVLFVVSVGVQWQGRSRLQSAEGFWPPTAPQPASKPMDSPPNIVLIVFDTLRVDRLSCYGYARPTSPHIDAFAADAVQFDRAVSPGIWTEPSHASLFTGLYRSQHGMGWNRIWLDDRFVTLAERLRDHGYQTIALSNNPNVSPGTNLTQGFEQFAEPARLVYWRRSVLYHFAKQVWAKGGPLGSVLGRWFVFDAGGHATSSLADALLQQRDVTRPFFLFINYMEPHWPYEPTRAYRRSFIRTEDLARSYDINYDHRAIYQYCLLRRPVYTPRDMKILSDAYDARVREMDDYFADLITVLRANTDLDNTMIILASDHGENLGEHKLLGHEFCIYNTLIHVPLIVRWPRILHPQRVDNVVQTHDVFPTILGWVGLDVRQSAKVMTRSLAEALPSTTASVYRHGYAEYLHPPTWAFKIARRRDPTFDESPWMVAYRAVVDRRWKLILGSNRRVELYDLSTDPAEERDMAAAHPREVKRLQRDFAGWRRSFEPFDPNRFTGPAGHRLDDDQVRRLRALGYVQ